MQAPSARPPIPAPPALARLTSLTLLRLPFVAFANITRLLSTRTPALTALTLARARTPPGPRATRRRARCACCGYAAASRCTTATWHLRIRAAASDGAAQVRACVDVLSNVPAHALETLIFEVDFLMPDEPSFWAALYMFLLSAAFPVLKTVTFIVWRDVRNLTQAVLHQLLPECVEAKLLQVENLPW
ncbi:hypothetical protein HDZ31DRAFT_61207 [Schizophyllum fasciatum]